MTGKLSRLQVGQVKRWVVKIGSAMITDEGRGLDHIAIRSWAEQIARLRERGKQVILVSSGAVAEGMTRLGWSQRPHALHNLQAAAAVMAGGDSAASPTPTPTRARNRALDRIGKVKSHSIAQPTVQPASLQSIPRRSTSLVSITTAPRSVLPICGPQAATCSYSGSSPTNPV